MKILPQRTQRAQRYIFLVLVLCVSCVSKHHETNEELQNDLLSSLEKKSQKNESLVRVHGSIDDTIDACLKKEQYDSDVLERIGLQLLEEGMQSTKLENQLTALYGIKIAQDERVETLASIAMKSHDPYLQLAALQVLGSYHTDESNKAIEIALKSDFLLIRLEAAYLLAQRKLPNAYPQLESLFLKVPEEVRIYFPDLFALEGGLESMHMIKKMIHGLDLQVRKEAIFAAAFSGFEELVQDIKPYAEDIHPVIQEVFAFSCLLFDMKNSSAILQKYQQKANGPQALMGAFSLYSFGDESGLQYIQKEAEKDNLFAIQLLGRIPGSHREQLIEKMNSSDLEVRYNAALALLERKDPVCLEVLFSFLEDTYHTYAVKKEFTDGKTLSCFKLIPLTEHHLKENPYLIQISKAIRAETIAHAIELQEADFVELCSMIFATAQHDLIPVVCTLLENLHSEQAFTLIKMQSERLGDPFIRTFCNLILYRTYTDPCYAAKIKEYVEANQKESFVQVIPSLPAIEQHHHKNNYSLTLDERAQLLVECFSTLAMKRDTEGVRTLLLAIRNGHPAHRPILAGLLLRASQ